MTEPFSFQDRRGRRTSATRGGVVLTPPPSSEVANAHNRSLTAQMNRSKLASGQRTAANLQMALPKTRQPLGSLMDKGIPFNTEDPKELSEARKLCNTPDAPVWMGDYSFKPIGEILPGEEVIGWVTEEQEFSRWGKSTHTRRKRILVKSTVLAVNRRMAPEVVKITFESGKTIKCTPDHEWLRYYPPNADGYITNGGPGNIERSWSKRYDSDYAPLQVGSVARFVMGQTEPLTDPEKLSAAHYLAGIIDGEGCWRNSTITFAQSRKVNPGVVERIDQAIETLGLSTYRYERVDHKPNNLGYQQKDFIVWDLSRSVGKTFSEACTDSIRIKNRQQLVDLYNWTHPAKMDIERMDKALLSSRFGVPDTVVSIESLGPGEVVSMQTTTGNYTAWGYASKNCRLYYRTHDLVPLLIDIYAKFPVVGLEFQSKDPLIEKFYSEMFLNDLNYEEFLPDLGREYFMVGEVNALAHFNEELGIWSSEEIIDPDMIRVSKSLFVQQERVQLLVKDMVERLRSGPDGAIDPDESPSERMERNKEYAELVKYYPEIIKAAAQDDGLDISDALISRIVNRANPNDVRGTPHLMRSFRTLMMEESLNAAQDAVADRLYAPLILATLGLPNLGDGEPWIPSPADLDDVRDDLQAALAADFKLMVHNLGLQVQNVFGRESVPRFDQDYQRIDSKLLQAWGIGEALIAGGTTGTYASSALNREVCEQLMFSFQNKIRRHIMKRCEIIAEAQQHYDFELKGGVRRPLYREVVEEDPETGEQYIRRVPKLLLPEIHFSTLNLRDESTERAFIAQLKAAGVPVSDKMMAVNLPLDFEQELERSANETVQKMVAQAQAMQKVQKLCDAQGLPYPPELATELTATLQLRQQLAQTDLMEDQAKMSELQTKQMTAPAAAGMGMLPGVPPPPPPEEEGGEKTAATTTTKPPGLPHSTGPQANAPHVPGPPMPDPVELPRNRIRPPESDEQRKNQPKTSAVNGEEPRKLSAFEIGPSSYGRSRFASEQDVERAVKRLEVISKHVPNPRVEDLIDDPEFYQALNATAYEDQIRADFPEVVAGGAGDSKKILDDLLEQYSEVFGIEPVW